MKSILIRSIALASILAAPAHAATVGHTFTGVTVSTFTQPAESTTEFPAGTRWTLRVEWDDAASPLGVFPNQAQYAASKIMLTLQGASGPWTTSSVSTNRSFGFNTGSSHEMQFTSGWGPGDHTNQTLVGSVQPYSINLVLGDPTATAISALTPAPKAINLAAWSADPTKSYFKFYLNNMGSQSSSAPSTASASSPSPRFPSSNRREPNSRTASHQNHSAPPRLARPRL